MYEPKFQITNTLLKQIAKIDAAQEVIVNAPLIPAWERKFQEEAVLRSVHHSTKIEGNKLSLNEVEKVLEGDKVQARRVRDIQEVVNYRNVVRYINEKFAEGEGKEVTEQHMKDIHNILTEEIIPGKWRGRYRDKKAMEVDVVSGDVVFEAVPPEEVGERTEEFFKWYNSEKGKEWHPVIRSGVIHYVITYIHPFVEGNGRTARSVATLSLYNDGYDIKRFFCLDEYYDQDVERYYEHLAHTDKTGDLTRWLEYMAEGLAEELDRIKEKIVELSRDSAFKKKVGGQVALSDRQIKIIKFIEKNGYLQNKHFRKLFPDISDDTVLREIKPLIKKGLLKKKGRTKAARYILA